MRKKTIEKSAMQPQWGYGLRMSVIVCLQYITRTSTRIITSEHNMKHKLQKAKILKFIESVDFLFDLNNYTKEIEYKKIDKEEHG